MKKLLEKLKVNIKPDIETLLTEINEFGYCATGRKYVVTDNAIRNGLD